MIQQDVTQHTQTKINSKVDNTENIHTYGRLIIEVFVDIAISWYPENSLRINYK